MINPKEVVKGPYLKKTSVREQGLFTLLLLWLYLGSKTEQPLCTYNINEQQPFYRSRPRQGEWLAPEPSSFESDLPDFLPSVFSGTSASFTSFCTAYPYWSSTNEVTTSGTGFGTGFGDGGRRMVGGCWSWNCGGIGGGSSMSWNRTVSVLVVRLFSKLRLRRIWKLDLLVDWGRCTVCWILWGTLTLILKGEVSVWLTSSSLLVKTRLF